MGNFIAHNYKEKSKDHIFLRLLSLIKYIIYRPYIYNKN